MISRLPAAVGKHLLCKVWLEPLRWAVAMFRADCHLHLLTNVW